MSDYPPELIEPEVSNLTMAPLWRYVAENWGEELADRVFSSAGLPPSYVRDPRGWVSYAYGLRVQEALGRDLFGLAETPPPGPDLLARVQQQFREQGLTVV